MVSVRHALALAVFISLIPVAGLLDVDLGQRIVSSHEVTSAEGYHLPPPPVIRALSFGYNETVADLLWVRTIAYFADHLTRDRDLRHLKRHLTNIIALDDHFKVIYRFGAAMLMSLGERRTTADVAFAIDLLQQAHQRYPDDYNFPLSIGIYYLSDMRTTDRKQRAAWKRAGADWIARAALISPNMPWLPTLAAKVYAEQGDRDVAIRRLRETYLVTPDPLMREQIAAKLRELESSKATAELRAAADELQRSYRESRFSFLPIDLFVLVNDKALPPFSLEAYASPQPAGR
jgi:hypothetical protein